MKRDKYEKKRRGWVALVGAGPGDPGLLTLRGRAMLGECDIVVYDRLVDEGLLDFAPQAKKIIAEKKQGKNKKGQELINRLLIREARRGKKVVRLKGGDPFIFGRGGEEAIALSKAGVPYVVVPGVSAGNAVPAYAGIPLTHRGIASEVIFVTGHEAGHKGEKQVDWSRLAHYPGTIVTFMGLRQLPAIVSSLRKGGARSRTRISVISSGTTGRQSVASGTIADIVSKVKKLRLQAPALAVIGEVNGLRAKLNWFERKPLFGRKVIVTRAKEQVGKFSEKLRQLGAEVVEIPTIQIKPVQHSGKVANVLKSLKKFDCLIFTSANGVEHFWSHLQVEGGDARQLSGLRIIVIGPGTGTRLLEMGVRADAVPEKFTTKEILELMKKNDWICGSRILLARSEIASKELVRGLRSCGAARVEDLVIYRTMPKGAGKQKINHLFSNGNLPYITFTSASTVTNFIHAVGRKKAAKISRKGRVVSIGPVTSKTARDLGMSVARQARESTIDGLVEAVLEDCKL